ncbi:ATP-binding cassette domain-containing protein [[Acholeplasma] multilocale]|uniref:ATP-binding cassette domain-containing protein n=1 Tax=[Acholeplasma] multilocale TaxID=264638 RepID=UPI00047E2524|nr:ATP-binding cassette domain-containing protein [[Acholeplasma] multilocale]
MLKINIQGIKYPDFRLVVKDLIINEGDVIGIIGLNGGGKSTFFANLIDPFLYRQNTIEIMGDFSISISHILQSDRFVDMKLKEIASTFKKLNNYQGDIEKLAFEFQLEKYWSNYYTDLSGGEQQRFKFLLLLIFQKPGPSIMILDECTSYLDVLWKDILTDMIGKLIKQNSATFIVEHDFELINKFCNRILVFKKGEIIMDKKLDEEINVEFIKKHVGTYDFELNKEI